MERQQFKKFCEKEFELQGFKKKKNMFYLKGVDLLCRINLQKSKNIIRFIGVICMGGIYEKK